MKIETHWDNTRNIWRRWNSDSQSWDDWADYPCVSIDPLPSNPADAWEKAIEYEEQLKKKEAQLKKEQEAFEIERKKLETEKAELEAERKKLNKMREEIEQEIFDKSELKELMG